MLSFLLQLLLLASGLVEVRLFTFSTLVWALALQGVLKVTRPTRFIGRVTKVTEINKPKQINKNTGVLINLRGGATTTADLPNSSFPLWNKELVGNFHQVDFWINKGKWLKLTTLFTPEGAQGVVSLKVTPRLGMIFFHHSVGEAPRVKHVNFRLKRKLVCCNPQDLPAGLRRQHIFPRGQGSVYGQARYYGNNLYKVTLWCDHPND